MGRSIRAGTGRIRGLGALQLGKEAADDIHGHGGSLGCWPATCGGGLSGSSSSWSLAEEIGKAGALRASMASCKAQRERERERELRELEKERREGRTEGEGAGSA